MFQTIRNAWKIKELRRKILYTLLLLFLYRLGCFVPVPGLNVAYLQSATAGVDILQLLNIMAGGALGKWTIFALGVGPYITSSIVMQLLTIAIPKLERMAKEGGEEGRKKIQKYTRYVAVALGFVEAVGIILSLGGSADTLIHIGLPTWLQYITIGLTLTAGTIFVMWIGERITEKGIGNGVSLIIFTGITANLPATISRYFSLVTSGQLNFWFIPLLLLGILVLITAITFVDMGERRLPVQYAKRVVGRKMYGGQSTHIPIKINSAGVLPLIFAMALLSFPQLIMQAFFSKSSAYAWYVQYMGTNSVIYPIIYALLIVLFAYFANSMTFNPVDIAKNMQQYGGFIPGIRPGRPTSDYIRRISNKLVLFGAVFLTIVAVIPMFFTRLTGMQSSFGATSLLIMVSVALETSKQLEAQMLARHYRGFLK
nr:preprotein translocase subunit SecY [Maliibacterium massiliense]